MTFIQARFPQLFICFTFFFLAGCASGTGAVAPALPAVQPLIQAQATPTVIPTTIPAADATDLPASPTPAPIASEDWKDKPIIPTLAPEMYKVYALGQKLGRDPHVVSVVGDCESSSEWFLKDFAKGPRYYDLGAYPNLQATIDYFNPSLGNSSYAAIRGATVSTVLTPLWADHKACSRNETPLDCEYRLHNPALTIIALGTNDIHHPENFEPKMRTILESTLSKGIIPILVTKADNLEGDESINSTIARLASEYHLPLWNFWAALRDLPDGGLQADGAHLTYATNFFNDPEKLKNAWPIRNLTALQTLDSLRLTLQSLQP
jgi:hypothetical protein